MSASSLSILTRAIPDPQSNDGVLDPQPVNSTLSYRNILSGDIRTLSAGGQAPQNVQGFLYLPDLTRLNAACQNASIAATGVDPTNDGGIPDSYSFIAIAPWFSAECVLAYMAQAKADAATAFIFYLPGSGAPIPPTANNGVWNLGDGGQWESLNHYPVYAIPGTEGMDTMAALARYSGKNLSAVPNGNILSGTYDSNTLLRLFMNVVVDDAPALPSLWNFLLIVLGILLFFVGTVSLAMHWFQRRRRANLQRRIINGEVDLAELGIVKRLTVPRGMLDKLPLQLYTIDEKAAPLPLRAEHYSREFLTNLSSVGDDGGEKSPEVSVLPRRNSDSTDLRTKTPALSIVPPSYASAGPEAMNNISQKDAVSASNPPSPDSPTTFKLSRFSQPTCAICLDDFVPSQTTIRVLPCDHIFHPDCVDDFLLKSSSLCPMCKTSVLPKDYCPTKVTNAMVRRERRLQIIRQARAERRRRQEAIFGPQHPSIPGNDLENPATRSRFTNSHRNRVISPISIPVPSLRLFRAAHVAGGRRISSAPTASTLELRRGQVAARPSSAVPDADAPVVPSFGLAADASTSEEASASEVRRAEPFSHAQSRREWARQRALALMSHRSSVVQQGSAVPVMETVTEVDREEARASSNKFRRALNAVFPGFS